MAAPTAPTTVSATPSNRSAIVSWFPPDDDGGAAITSYTVTSQNVTTSTAGPSISVPAPPVRLTNLTAANDYTFAVTATNGDGTSPASTPSPAVTILAAGVPDTPLNPSAVAGDAEATVNFTVPAYDGGAAITGYTVLATDEIIPGNGGQTATGASSPIVVTGLTNDDGYTFQVKATNSVGDSAYSGKSSLVIPIAASSTPPEQAPYPNAADFPLEKPVNILQLQDEILAEVGGSPLVAVTGNTVPLDQISPTNSATLWVAPDTIPTATIEGILDAHVANPLYGMSAAEAAFLAAVQKIMTDPDAVLTADELQAAVKGLILRLVYDGQIAQTPL